MSKVNLYRLIEELRCNEFRFLKFENVQDNKSIPKMTKILIDGNWIGFTYYPLQFLKEFKELRSVEEGSIPIEVSINLDYINKEIRMQTDAGRCMRPLFVVDNNKLRI